MIKKRKNNIELMQNFFSIKKPRIKIKCIGNIKLKNQNIEKTYILIQINKKKILYERVMMIDNIIDFKEIKLNLNSKYKINKICFGKFFLIILLTNNICYKYDGYEFYKIDLNISHNDKIIDIKLSNKYIYILNNKKELIQNATSDLIAKNVSNFFIDYVGYNKDRIYFFTNNLFIYNENNLKLYIYDDVDEGFYNYLTISNKKIRSDNIKYSIYKSSNFIIYNDKIFLYGRYYTSKYNFHKFKEKYFKFFEKTGELIKKILFYRNVAYVLTRLFLYKIDVKNFEGNFNECKYYSTNIYHITDINIIDDEIVVLNNDNVLSIFGDNSKLFDLSLLTSPIPVIKKKSQPDWEPNNFLDIKIKFKLEKKNIPQKIEYNEIKNLSYFKESNTKIINLRNRTNKQLNEILLNIFLAKKLNNNKNYITNEYNFFKENLLFIIKNTLYDEQDDTGFKLLSEKENEINSDPDPDEIKEFFFFKENENNFKKIIYNKKKKNYEIGKTTFNYKNKHPYKIKIIKKKSMDDKTKTNTKYIVEFFSYKKYIKFELFLHEIWPPNEYHNKKLFIINNYHKKILDQPWKIKDIFELKEYKLILTKTGKIYYIYKKDEYEEKYEKFTLSEDKKSFKDIIYSSKNFCINFFKENNLSILNIFSDSNYKIFFVYCKNKNKEYFLYKCDTEVQNLLNTKLNSNNIIKNIIYNTKYILIKTKNNPLLLFNDNINICKEIKLNNKILDILKLAKKIYLTYENNILILYKNNILKYKIISDPCIIIEEHPNNNNNNNNIIDILYYDFDTRSYTLFLLTNKYDILSLGFFNYNYIYETNIHENISKDNCIAQFYKYNMNSRVSKQIDFIRSNYITLFSYKKKNIQINQTHQLKSDIAYTNTIDNKKKFISKYYTIFLYNNNSTIDLHYIKNKVEVKMQINNINDYIKIKNIFCTKSFFFILSEHDTLYYISIKHTEDILKKIKLKHYNGILNVDTVYSCINSDNHIIKYKNNDYTYFLKKKNLSKQTNEIEFKNYNFKFLSFLYKSNSYQIKYIYFFKNIVIILFVNNFIIILYDNMKFIRFMQLDYFKNLKKNINYCSDCMTKSIDDKTYWFTFNCYSESVKYGVCFTVYEKNNRIEYKIK